jgi:hypothetical protein
VGLSTLGLDHVDKNITHSELELLYQSEVRKLPITSNRSSRAALTVHTNVSFAVSPKVLSSPKNKKQLKKDKSPQLNNSSTARSKKPQYI